MTTSAWPRLGEGGRVLEVDEDVDGDGWLSRKRGTLNKERNGRKKMVMLAR